MVEGRPQQQQLAQKVKGKPDENNQDGQAQSCPKQARHLVGESRARTHGEAASVGAAIIAGRALGSQLDPDRLDPVGVRERPFDSDVVAYGDLRMRHEMVARATISALAGG